MNVKEMFAHWEQIRADTLMLLDRFTEADLDYCAYPGGWPVGQVFIHIGSSEQYWMQHCNQGKPHVSLKFQDYPSRAQIKTALNDIHQQTLAWMSGLKEGDLALHFMEDDSTSHTLYWAIWHVIEHEAHHRGELSLILGLLGRQGWGD